MAGSGAPTTGPVPGRSAAALAALLAAGGVALGAYAAHAADALAAGRLRLAAFYLLLHGIAVLALLGRRGRWLARARSGLLLGVVLFSGSLATTSLLAWPSTLAPLGGGLLIASWLVLALALYRGEGVGQ